MEGLRTKIPHCQLESTFDGESRPKLEMGRHTMKLKLVFHLQLPAHDQRTVQVDVADVGDY